ncbi:MAG: hypothetical protein ACI87T_003223, partial [Planctomycetota bacterium]
MTPEKTGFDRLVASLPETALFKFIARRILVPGCGLAHTHQAAA